MPMISDGRLLRGHTQRAGMVRRSSGTVARLTLKHAQQQKQLFTAYVVWYSTVIGYPKDEKGF